MKKSMISQKSNGHSKVSTSGRSAGGDTAYIPTRSYKGDVDVHGKNKPGHGGVTYKGVKTSAY